MVDQAATSAVGYGTKATGSRNRTLRNRNVGVVRRMIVNIWWWLTHITPIVRKLVT